MSKLLVIDTETGGTDPLTHSILSIAGVVWEDSAIKAEIEILILEDPLIVTPRALEINRISLVEHAQKALPPEVACKKFQDFVHVNWYGVLLEDVVLVGHNVAFDIGFAKRLYRIANTPFRFSHRSLDTASILRFLFLCGLVPESALSSTGGFSHFNIDVPAGERHTALGDARATTQLLTKMIKFAHQTNMAS